MNLVYISKCPDHLSLTPGWHTMKVHTHSLYHQFPSTTTPDCPNSEAVYNKFPLISQAISAAAHRLPELPLRITLFTLRCMDLKQLTPLRLILFVNDVVPFPFSLINIKPDRLVATVPIYKIPLLSTSLLRLKLTVELTKIDMVIFFFPQQGACPIIF